jgi:2-keto-4-pentenoate hydratase
VWLWSYNAAYALNNKKDGMRIGILLLVLTTLLAATSAPALAEPDAQSWAMILQQERRAKRPFPVISQYERRLTIENAYAIQRQFLDELLQSESIAGYKAAATTTAAQQRLQIREPIFGVLFSRGRRGSGLRLSRGDFGNLMLEAELGYIAARDIRYKPRDIEQWRFYFESVVPVVELPDVDYEDPKAIRGVDVIATNAASSLFIVGKPVPLADFEPFELDGIYVELARDGYVVSRGQGSYTLYGQWSALEWLIGKALDEGRVIKRGDLVITGVLGEMVPGLPGRYEATYRGLSPIEFEIVLGGSKPGR